MKNTINTLFVIIILNITCFAQSPQITFYNIEVSTPDSMNYIRVNTLITCSGINSIETDTLYFELCKNFKGVYFDSMIVKVNEIPVKTIKKNANEIRINIPKQLHKNDRISFSFQYCLLKTEDFETIPYSDFAMQANKNDLHINAAITRTDNWFPKLRDNYINRLPNFNLTIIVPLEYEVMASGKLTETRIENNKKHFLYTNYNEMTDRSLFFFINKNIRIEKIYKDDFKLSILIPKDTLKGNVDFLAELVHSSYKHYEKLYGSTNLNSYKLNAFVNKDMGFSGLYNSSNAPDWLFTKPIVNNELYFPSRNVAHEVSHTWWGNIVAPDAGFDYWLFEGFAKFSEPQYLRTILGDSIETLYRNRLKIMIAADADFLPPLKFISAEIQNNQLKSEAAYYQGALFLYTLLDFMGKNDFWLGMQEYVKNNRGKIVNSDDFFNAMQNNTTKNIKEFYYDFLNKPGFAKYAIQYKKGEKQDSIFKHCLQIENTGDKVLFTKFIKNNLNKKDTGFIYLTPGVTNEIIVFSYTSDTSNLLLIDPDNVFLVKEEGIVSPGAKLYRENTGLIRIFEILPESPFGKSGLENNSKIVSINNNKMTDFDFGQLNNFLLQKKGHLFNVVIEDSYNKQQIFNIQY